MALLFTDGFDVYDSEADVLTSRWTQPVGTTHTYSTTAGRYGGSAVGGLAANDAWNANITGTSLLAGDTFWVSFAYKHDGNGSNVGDGDRWQDCRDAGGGRPWNLYHKADGTVSLRDANNTSAGSSASGVLTANVWHWIELRVVMGTNNTNGSLELKVDGAVAVTASGIDTLTGGGAMVGVRFQGSSGEFWMDDVIINDNVGSFNTPPGDCRIDTLRPVSDGGVTDWTGSYTDVDDALGASDGDTTYITSTTPGQENRFGLSALAGSSDDIFGIQVRNKARNTTASVRTVRALINSGGVEAVGSDVVPPTTYGWTQQTFVVDPNGGTAFTDADISALEAGIEVVS